MIKIGSFNELKVQKKHYICNNANVFKITFDQFNASLVNISSLVISLKKK